METNRKAKEGDNDFSATAEASTVAANIGLITVGLNDGIRDISYTYYVKYQTQDGKIVEAKLGNAPAHLYVGSTLRVKYLPEKPKYVIPAK